MKDYESTELVIQLHNIARTIEQKLNNEDLSKTVRQAADNLDQFLNARSE